MSLPSVKVINDYKTLLITLLKSISQLFSYTIPNVTPSALNLSQLSPMSKASETEILLLPPKKKDHQAGLPESLHQLHQGKTYNQLLSVSYKINNESDKNLTDIKTN